MLQMSATLWLRGTATLFTAQTLLGSGMMRYKNVHGSDSYHRSVVSPLDLLVTTKEEKGDATAWKGMMPNSLTLDPHTWVLVALHHWSLSH